MECYSIFNDVLGPVIRGPSSSHTAGSYHIGRIARSLLGEKPASAVVSFDPDGSYARVYKQQGVEPAFAAGLMGWSVSDNRFPDAHQQAAQSGIDLKFNTHRLAECDHPNCVDVVCYSSKNTKLHIKAKSIGGGNVVITDVDGWPVPITGKTFDTLVLWDKKVGLSDALDFLSSQKECEVLRFENEKQILFQLKHLSAFNRNQWRKINATPGRIWVRQVEPLYRVVKNPKSIPDVKNIISEAEKQKWSLGQFGLHYESEILGISQSDVKYEMLKRYEIMKSSVDSGLENELVNMRLLQPSASDIVESDLKRELAVGGLHTRAAARAMAVMHTNNSMGVVCAAPTGGSAGVIPGMMVTLAEEKGITSDQIVNALFAASVIGLFVLKQATFAAEIAGCQVEIGAAGAMAAAAVVETAGGTIHQALDAAAISFQNTMGSVCDLVQGMCEIPCHTRNAVAASNAFVNADLILGGYQNPIPLDETIDAVFSVGRMLPKELRCTVLGGLAVTPSAQKMRSKS